MVNHVDHHCSEECSAMTVIPAPESPTHELEGTRFTSLATPSRGCRDTAVWQVEIEAGTPPTPPHRVTREEIFVVLDGEATVDIADEQERARAGDTIVVPIDVDFSLANAGA